MSLPVILRRQARREFDVRLLDLALTGLRESLAFARVLAGVVG
jgi:hypothetical protein